MNDFSHAQPEADGVPLESSSSSDLPNRPDVQANKTVQNAAIEADKDNALNAVANDFNYVFSRILAHRKEFI